MNYLKAFFAIYILFIIDACKKQSVSLSTKVNDIFWLSENGSDMPVWVKGNTLSKVIIVVIHGGPGEGAYNFSDYETTTLQQKYGVAFWDQRDAGASAGNSNYSNISITQMVKDMKDLILLLKYRYANPDIFLYAHSFGALLASAYLTKDSNQSNIKGWIEIDGAHNYPLANSASRQMLIDTGISEINKVHNVYQWIQIEQYCKTHDPDSSYDASVQIQNYAHNAEGYMGIQQEGQTINLFSQEDPFSLFANLFKMYSTSAGIQFNKALQNANYSNQLYLITIPSLLLWGQYDFTVPSIVGKDALSHLGSAYKKFVLFPHSGHRPMQGDTNAVEDEITSFIEKFR